MRLSRTLSSRTTSLFSEPTRLGQGPSSLLVSIVVHGVALGLLSWGFLYSPQVAPPALARRYNVRKISLHEREPQSGSNAGSGIRYPRPQSNAPAVQFDSGKKAAPRATVQLAQAAPGLQTLLQPDFPDSLPLSEEVPVPAVMIWTPKKNPVNTIVPPLPDKPTAADVKPSPNAPNEALKLGDRSIQVSDSDTQMLMPPASTTSPVALQRPELVQLPPVTASDSSSQPTPVAVLSLSDLRMREGTATLPPVNEALPATSLSKTEDVLAKPAQAQGIAGISEPDASARADKSATEDIAATTKHPAAGLSGQAGSGPGSLLSTSRLTLPKNGQYEVVVVGASLEDEYPEIFQIWAGRMAYTVYLPVGETRNWILQYSLPRSAAPTAAEDNGRLLAPWPYEVVKPRLAPGDFISDAIVVHGFVNGAGHFESLAVVYPVGFQYVEFVLNALQRWQFRPAALNGQATAVEIVLVIPQEGEIGK